MDVPPDINIPEGLPLVRFRARWARRFERVAIELANLFDRTSRQRQLANSEEKWSISERESLSVRLAAHELTQRYGPTTAFRIATLRLLPRDMNARARLYQRNVLYEQSVNGYRVRLGLPPRDKPAEPSPP
jgi:hypothetical protein